MLFRSGITVGRSSECGTGAEEIGRTERSPTAWRPFIWPIKLVMVVGIFLMLLQALSELVKDVFTLRGIDMIPEKVR